MSILILAFGLLNLSVNQRSIKAISKIYLIIF
jgi:hypothetical protein